MQGQLHTPVLTKTNKIIIIAAVATFLLGTILKTTAGFSLAGTLGLSINSFWSGHVYQLVTYPFVQSGVIGTLFSCLIIWFIGADLEQNWGVTFYRKYIVVCALGAPLLFVILGIFLWGDGSIVASTPLIGLNSITYALLTAYGIIYSDRPLVFMFLFPIKAKYFCMILGALEFYNALFSQFNKTAWVHVLSIVIGFFYLSYLSRKSKGGGISFNLIKKMKEQKVKERRSKIRVVQPVEGLEDNKPPKYWH